MNLVDRANAVQTREQLADYVALLRKDLEENKGKWENITLDDYFESLEEYIRVINEIYLNTGQEEITQPSWAVFARMLYGPKVYE